MAEQAKRYLSHGGGINSWALYLWLRDRGIEFEAVYASHGADWPETQQYMADRIAEGYPVTILETRRGGLDLYDYYLAHGMVPMRVARACTVEYKLVPLASHMTPPCTVYLGIDAGESHRANRIIEGCREAEEKMFPLIEYGIDRAGCVEIIKAHGLPVPLKSGCFICPFQRRGQWVALRTQHPDLYCRAKRLEDSCNARMAAEGRRPIYLSDQDRPLDQVAMDSQADLFGERDMTPCLCDL